MHAIGAAIQGMACTCTALRSVLVDAPSSELGAGHIGSFYKLRQKLLKEVLPDTAPTGSRKIKGGHLQSCRGLQDEVAATETQAVMFRHSMHLLRTMLLQDGSRVLLRGPVGSGKSIALAAIVEWARADGWIVMYIPAASDLTQGGYFLRRPDTGRFDTILSAQQILRSTVQAHGQQLAGLARSSPSGGTLLDLANSGLGTDRDASLAVDACLSLKEELALAASKPTAAPHPAAGSPPAPEPPLAAEPQKKVLFAIDEYNSLHWRTGYGRDGGEGRRVPLKVDDLSLASGFRLLADTSGLKHARLAVALSESTGVPNDVKISASSDVATFHMPRYSLAEAAYAMHWYWENGLAPAVPTKNQIRGLHALTNGNAKEIRTLAPKMTLLNSGMI